MSINGKKVVASIEGRMTSTRLPGKVVLPCLNRPMLELMIERVRRSQYIDTIVVATTINSTDEPIAELARRLKVEVFRGSEPNVVGRVTQAHEKMGTEIVVQLTADCPLIDPEIIDQLLTLYALGHYDYVSNILIRSYPDGLDVQISSLRILQKTLALCQTDEDTEHLYSTLFKKREQFSTFNLLAPEDLLYPNWRWTLDTQEDYQHITSIFEALYPINPSFTSMDIVKYELSHA